MAMRIRAMILVIGGALLAAESARTETPSSEPRPSVHTPAPPRAREELNRLRARELYARALLAQRAHQLGDAIQDLEEAIRLDPEATAARKALVPLYLLLDRSADALLCCRKILERSPGDFETWYLEARQLREQGRAADAVAALAKAFACSTLREFPDFFLQVGGDLALAYEESPEPVRALAVYEELANTKTEEEDAPRRAEAYEALARVAMKVRSPGRAVRALRDAQALLKNQDPLRVRRLHYALASAFEAQGHAQSALESLDEYLRTQPSEIEPYQFRIRLLKQLGRSEEVVKSLEDLAARDPFNRALKRLLGQQFAEHGQPREAEALYLRVAGEMPDAEIYRALFALYRSQGRAGAALALLDQAVREAAEKDHRPLAAARAQAMLGVLSSDKELAEGMVQAASDRLRAGQPLQPAVERLFALLAAQTHQLGAAEALYRDALTTADPRSEAALYSGLLQVLWQAHKYADVITLCRKGLKDAQATNRLVFHHHLARALVLSGKADEALVEADQAVQLADDDNRLQLRLFRIEILRLADRLDKALAECQQLLRDTTEPAAVRDVRYSLSGVYTAARNFQSAEEQLRLILKANPNDATANNDLGYILADQNKALEEAEAMIHTAIRLDQEQRQAGKSTEDDVGQTNAAYTDSLGWVLFRRGRLSDAQRELEKAVALPEGAADPVVWDHLGDIYFRLGDQARAGDAWEKALTLYEVERRRQRDDQYRDLKRKLKLLKPQLHP